MRDGAREAFIENARNNVKAPSDLTKEKALDELGVTDASERKFTQQGPCAFHVVRAVRTREG